MADRNPVGVEVPRDAVQKRVAGAAGGVFNRKSFGRRVRVDVYCLDGDRKVCLFGERATELLVPFGSRAKTMIEVRERDEGKAAA